MTRSFNLTVLLAVLGMTCCTGCVSWKSNQDPYSGHWRLLDSRQQILDEKFDRARLEAMAGKPTIDDGEEWVYVSKFAEGKVIPLGMLVAIYASAEKPVWKTTVVTFDEAGVVSNIRTENTRSEIYEEAGDWTLMGVNIKKDVRLRRVPATQAGTTRSFENSPDRSIPSAPGAR